LLQGIPGFNRMKHAQRFRDGIEIGPLFDRNFVFNPVGNRDVPKEDPLL